MNDGVGTMTDDRRKQNDASKVHVLWKKIGDERIAIIGGNGVVLRYGISVHVEGPFQPGQFYAVLSKFEQINQRMEASLERVAKLNRISELKNFQKDLESRHDD